MVVVDGRVVVVVGALVAVVEGGSVVDTGTVVLVGADEVFVTVELGATVMASIVDDGAAVLDETVGPTVDAAPGDELGGRELVP